MKLSALLKYYYQNRRVLERLKPKILELHVLRKAGADFRLLTSEGKVVSIPSVIMPVSRIVGNLVSEGYSTASIEGMIDQLSQQIRNRVLSTARPLLLNDCLRLKECSPVIFGATFGDEGKGRVGFFMADYVGAAGSVRFNGGPNSGKVVVTDTKTYEFCMLPAGVAIKGMKVFFSQGVMLLLSMLRREIENLEKNEISTKDRVFISSDCHLILRFHVDLSSAKNVDRSQCGSGNHGFSEGSTGTGVGGAVGDKTARRGIRVCDLYNGTLRGKLERIAKITAAQIRELTGDASFAFSKEYIDEVERKLDELAEYFRPMVVYNMPNRLREMMLGGRRLVFEGSQAALLDVNSGVYPFVTSLSTTLGSLFDGTGLSPSFFPIRLSFLASRYYFLRINIF